MRIYIASSWKNHHGVEMLTKLLRERQHTVFSWIENNREQKAQEEIILNGFEDWLLMDSAERCFHFDTRSIADADLVIYYAPAGMDAAAEIGLAYGKSKRIVGLAARGDGFGLMRKMVLRWFSHFDELLAYVTYLELNGASRGY